MKYFKNFLLFSFALFALTAFVTPAYALLIDITTEPTPTPIFAFGDETSQNAINDALALLISGAGIGFELYKDNVGGIEEGPLWGSYNTTYSNSPSDPEDADITYTGGGFISDNPFLLVKGGNQSPAWYLFDLAALGWNGTETLELRNFWVPSQDNPNGNGAISHVALYGSTPIPEPATMALFGLGLIGIAGIGRKTRKN